MGNNSTRESRPNGSHRHGDGGTSGPTSPTDRNHPHLPYNSRNGRGSRVDLSSILGIGGPTTIEVPERRETKQEREARKLEKERVARIKERERSIKEEHVDGGFLVTMGVYSGHEDFHKPIVRQLMIERRIAPFWRGLDDFKEDWTEHQLVAAGRGIPIPAADEVPPELLTRGLSTESANASNHNLQNLMVPITGRSLSASSDTSTTLSPSNPTFSLPSPTSPAPPPSAQSSSPFRPRSKTLASLTSSSKTTPASELTPREIHLPNDPFVNGQQIEVFLYKDASECPICFLYYPPYLNKTRCCDQSICSECFVQIKRPDPHPPEHETNDPSNPQPPPPEEAGDPEQLVSEPSTCPYCQQAEFGVTYEAPPFRRGLSYTSPGHGLTSLSSAMSSSSSLNSTGPPAVASNAQRRRTTSISANAPTVITTDRIRPDWATKLANARSHLARRSAAATALHTAAYMMGNNESRGFGFASRSRFGRHRGDNSPGASGAATPSSTTPVEGGPPRTVAEQVAAVRREVHEGGSSRRRNRMEDLEEMMMLEAIRLSLAAEEEEKRKREKEAAKEAKKRAKEDKKREKAERKIYGSGASSTSGSALSLSLPGMGRRRGNSGASNLGREFTLGNVDSSDTKGKGVDHGIPGQAGSSPNSRPLDIARGENKSNSGIPGARHFDQATLATFGDSHQPSPSPTAPEKPSHLRQMSNASSPASSFAESVAGSLRNDSHIPHSKGHYDDTLEGEDTNDNVSSEPMFNFKSLAAMIGEEDGDADDKQDAAKHIEYLNGGEGSEVKKQEDKTNPSLEESISTIKPNVSGVPTDGDSRQTTLLQQQNTTPEVKVTSETPAALDHREEEGKQLGSGWTEEVSREITQ